MRHHCMHHLKATPLHAPFVCNTNLHHFSCHFICDTTAYTICTRHHCRHHLCATPLQMQFVCDTTAYIYMSFVCDTTAGTICMRHHFRHHLYKLHDKEVMVSSCQEVKIKIKSNWEQIEEVSSTGHPRRLHPRVKSVQGLGHTNQFDKIRTHSCWEKLNK